MFRSAMFSHFAVAMCEGIIILYLPMSRNLHFSVWQRAAQRRTMTRGRTRRWQPCRQDSLWCDVCQRVLAVPIAIPNCLPQWTDKVLDCMCGSVLNRATMCSGNEMMAASQCDTDMSWNFPMYWQKPLRAYMWSSCGLPQVHAAIWSLLLFN